MVTLSILLAIWFGLSAFFRGLSLNLGDVLGQRLLTYTQEQIFDPQNSLQSLRFLEIATTADAVSSAPIFGHGLGSGLGTVVSNGATSEFVILHNYYFNLIAKAGFVGVALLAFLLWRVWKTLRLESKLAESPLQRGVILTAVVSLVWYGIFMAFQPVYSAYNIPSLLGIYVGLVFHQSAKCQVAADRLR